MPITDAFAAASKLADIAAWIDEAKFKLPEPLKQEGAMNAETLHGIAEQMAGRQLGEVYALEKKDGAVEVTLPVTGFLVCSTDEQVVIPEPRNSLAAAIKLRDESQAGDTDETWEILAELAL